MSFTEQVRAAMREAGITQVTLSDRLGISQQAVSDRLTGRVRWRFDEVLAVASVLELELMDVMDAASADTSPQASALAATTAAAGGRP